MGVKVYNFGRVSSLVIQKCQYQSATSKELLRHKLETSCDVLATAKNVSPFTCYSNCFKFDLGRSYGHRIRFKDHSFVPALGLRISQVEVEIPDVKIFSDSTQISFDLEQVSKN